MKKITIVLLMSMIVYCGNAQVTIGSATVPQSSSVLDLQSGGNKALLLPRVADTSAVITPAGGMMIFDETAKKLYFYTGSFWQELPGGYAAFWKLNGNIGTDTLIHFLGTIDSLPLLLKTNNKLAAYISAAGNIGIGTNKPNAKLAIQQVMPGPETVYNEGFESAALGAAFTTSGNANWAVTNSAAKTGTYSAASGTITHNQSTIINLSLNIPSASTLSFAYKVSSEANYDFLVFRIDDVFQTKWSGDQQFWSTATYQVNAGAHTFTWEYFKDNTASKFSDKAWIDDIFVTTIGGVSGMPFLSISDVSGSISLLKLDNSGNLGLGTDNPTTKLDIRGSLRISDGSEGIGRYLVSDATGRASWSPGIGGWLTTGNAGTDPNINFIGTTDNAPIVFKAKNNFMGYLDADTSKRNTFMGEFAGFNNFPDTTNTFGRRNTAFGALALYWNMFSSDNVAVGNNACYNCGGLSPDGRNTAIGAESMYSTTYGTNNTAVGYKSLYYNTLGNNNTAIGLNALPNNTLGNSNVAIGKNSLLNNSIGNFNVAVGENAGEGGVEWDAGSYNTFIGRAYVFSYYGVTDKGNNTIIGAINRIGKKWTGNTLLGSQIGAHVTDALPDTLDYNIVIADGNGNRRINVIDNGYVGIGTTTPTALLTVAADAKINGVSIGTGSPPSYTNAKTNTVFGYMALEHSIPILGDDTYGMTNTAVGAFALQANTRGFGNSAFGYAALKTNITGYENSAFGVNALFSNTTGNFNSAFGVNALYSNTTGWQNTAVGDYALESNLGSFSNTAFGYEALRYNTTGAGNTVVGAGSGKQIITGEYNTILGYNVVFGGNSGDVSAASNNTIIGSNITTSFDQSNMNNNVIIADGSGNIRIIAIANGNVGIGTLTPQAKLQVNGTIKATKINFSGLVTYADDAAAGAGGLVSGDMYKTSTGELRIKL